MRERERERGGGTQRLDALTRVSFVNQTVAHGSGNNRKKTKGTQRNVIATTLYIRGDSQIFFFYYKFSLNCRKCNRGILVMRWIVCE